MLLGGRRLCRSVARCAICALALLIPLAASAVPFGDNGVAIPPIYIPGGESVTRAALVQADGKIVVAGTTDGPLAPTMFAARFTSAGVLDPTYGTGGIAFVPLPEQAIQLQAKAATLDRNGNVVIAGLVTYPVSALKNQNIAIVRLTSSGNPDATFGNGGFSEIPVDGTFANGVAADSQGRVVVIASPGFLVYRLTQAGSLDSSFNGTGLLTIVAPSYSSYQLPTSVQIDAGDSVVVGGLDEEPSSPDTPFTPFVVLRITNSGQPNSSFNGGSLVRLQHGDSSRLDSAGRILVVGSTATSVPDGQIEVTRVTTAGAPDPAFGVNGVALFPFPGQLTIPSPLTIALDSTERIVVGIGGLGMQGEPLSAVRFTANGDVDTTFNGTGSQSVRLGASSPDSFQPTPIAIDARDGVFLAGSENVWLTIGAVQNVIQEVFLARVDNAGAIDTAFGAGGAVLQACGVEQVTPTGMIEQPDGKLIVGGYTGASPFDPTAEFLVARLTTSGALDPVFNGTGFRVLDVTPYASNAANAVALDAVGNVILAGKDTSSSFAVARVTPSGALDTTFNGTGTTIVSGTSIDEVGATGVTVDALGNIVVVGQVPISGGTAFGVVRLTSAGALDLSFAGSGLVNIPLSATYGQSQPAGVAIDSRGRIVVGGWYDDPSAPYCARFVAIRLTKAGLLDGSFAGTGVATVPGCLGLATGVALAPSDGVVVAGTKTLSRLTSSGSIDASFGGTGVVTATTTFDTSLEAVTVDSGGRVFVVGDTLASSILGRRFTALGVPDPTLNAGQPINIFPTASAAGSRPVATLVDAAGNTYIAGQVGRSIAVIKLLAGVPSNLAVVSVNGGAHPAADTPFAVILGAQDDSGAPQPVSQDTSIALALKQGSGSLTGTLTCIIPAGNTNCTVSGVVYSVTDTNVILSVTTTAGDVLEPGESFPFNVDQATTTTTLTSSINPSPMGQSVTFTGVVAGADPSGAIYFFADNVWIPGCGGVPLSGAGNTKIAVCTTNQLLLAPTRLWRSTAEILSIEARPAQRYLR